MSYLWWEFNTLDQTNQKDVLDAVLRLPISLESIDTNGSILGHVWVEDLGEEKS